MKKFFKIICFLTFYVCFINHSFGAIKYQITGLTDSSSTYTPGVNTGNLVVIKTACIYKQGTGTQYRVTATSSRASGTLFRVYDGISEYVIYDVVWYDTINQTGTSANLDSGVTSTTLFSNLSNVAGCPGGHNASFTITFTQAAIQAVTSGTYTDTLSITIGPV